MSVKIDREHPALPYEALDMITVGQGFSLLDDVLVVDLSNSIAGPVASMLLGDLGARVIKVEKPGIGDDARAWGPPYHEGDALWFQSVNRNKESLTLDYSTEAGLDILDRLVAISDVFIVNQTPAVARARRVDEERLRAIKPDLIYVSITGFGMSGARSDWTCYDLIAEGYSGVMDLTGEPGSPPQKVGAPAADMLAGQDAAFAAIAALYARNRSKEGRTIDVSLVNSMTRFLSCRIVPYLGSGEVPRRSGGTDSVIAIYQTFDTKDEPMTLALGTNATWQRFWDVVGEPRPPHFKNYDNNERRRAARAEIVAAIRKVLARRTRNEWLALFSKARVPAGPIYRVDELANDEELRRQKLIYTLADRNRLVPQVNTGFRIDGNANVPRSSPPRLGEHTDDILANVLSYDQDAIARLKSSKTV